MRILIVDNTIDRECWGSPELQRFAVTVPGATVTVRRGPESDLPKDISNFDRIVLSGSKTSAMENAPWISRLEDLIRCALSEGKPFLGVCYGHQMLARTLGGKEFVRQSVSAEFGWCRIEQLADSPLFHGLPRVFYSFSSHYDEVSVLPSGTELLACSEQCAIQAIQVKGHPVFGIQFHPEKDLEGGTQTLAECQKKGKPKKLLHPNEGMKLFQPEVGEILFRNFFNL